MSGNAATDEELFGLLELQLKSVEGTMRAAAFWLEMFDDASGEVDKRQITVCSHILKRFLQLQKNVDELKLGRKLNGEEYLLIRAMNNEDVNHDTIKKVLSGEEGKRKSEVN